MIPAISVIMPVYNVDLYVAESIESMLNQTFSDFEFIIINDGSTDKTAEIVASYKDPRIVFVNHPVNRKKIACLNDGLKMAKGKYIALMDGDDISLRSRLEKQYNYLEENSEIGLCGVWFECFGEFNKEVRYPTRHDEIYFDLFTKCPLTATLIRKNILLNHNIIFDADFFSEDSYIYVKLAHITKLANYPEILYKYRIHIKQVSQKFKSLIRPSIIHEKNIHFNNLIIKLTRQPNKEGVEFYPTKQLSLNDIKKFEKLILKLIEENEREKIFPQHIIEQSLSKQWYRLFDFLPYNNINGLIYFILSPLRKISNLTLKQFFKFFIKCIIFKKSYNHLLKFALE
jgi:glycosyltransferase involved in cell wall biosynthesis